MGLGMTSSIGGVLGDANDIVSLEESANGTSTNTGLFGGSTNRKREADSDEEL